ncbi:MAG TPA: Asp-tRNA(Asn)/Glu-tRNA(Gln) amidotransferase subunit GatB [Nitrososphaeraceae archaeon]|nr:Asp-tRNA(Asn)/Glu-tRNA(Gln) amidotransferase subunit GatB [Nitrososphaeraceae archaeon]
MANVLIGLEIHCQLTSLKSKLFCFCHEDYRSFKPNSNICPICCGFPGTLPLLNQKAVEHAAMISNALGSKIPEKIMFYRKNYFYPDLPKNFQITQYNSYGLTSIGSAGSVYISDSKTIRIRRVQLEEDPGRLSYDSGNIHNSNLTLIDYNRSGVGLVEIVTEPDFTDPREVRYFLNKLSSILEHLGVCDTTLEGAVRCDANVSLKGGERIEIKNVNSFREVEKALTYEISRQTSLSTRNIKINSETRHWDEQRKITRIARTKEEEQDYRYFPEPDIPLVMLGKDFQTHIGKFVPELPDERLSRFKSKYTLSDHVANILINSKKLADFFESCLTIYYSPVEIANWLVNDLLALIGGEETMLLDKMKLEPKHMAELAKLVDEKKISRSTAKQIFTEVFRSGQAPSQLLDRTDSSQINDENFIANAVDVVFSSEVSAVEDAKVNSSAINFLVGKVMKITKGRADPKIVTQLINVKLTQLGNS